MTTPAPRPTIIAAAVQFGATISLPPPARHLVLKPSLDDAARDIKILLAQIDYLQEAFSEELGEEDAGIVLQIRETWTATEGGR